MNTVEVCVQKLTLEEKAALLQGCTNWTTWHIPRLSIPSIRLSDGPHGLRRQVGKDDHLGLNDSEPATCFPTAAAMANSWDPELSQLLGRALGEEAAAQKVHVLLGPGLNMKRSPLCGRNFEYFSEDPYLAGKLAAAYIRGIQSTGVAACPKHFAANSQETSRLTTDSVIDERTLREIYLTGFEIAVKEGAPKAIMSAYNPVNGVYANENSHLLTEILRNEWGFDGFVVTDWGAANNKVEGVRAGSNLEMPCPGADSALTLIEAVRSGALEESIVDQRLTELLQVIQDTAQALEQPISCDTNAHHDLARQCAAASAVLLENDGILPLGPETRTAIIGAFAETPRYQGAGSSQVHPTRVDTLKTALEESHLSVIGYAPGYTLGNAEPDSKLIAEAVSLARKADVVVLSIGLEDASESEGMDRPDMKLPKSHTALLKAVARVNPNVVLVLSGGAPFVMPPSDRFRAAVHGYLSGQAGAAAMADILCGHINPSGHLAETWPMRLEDTPVHSDFPAQENTACYWEGPYIGYRYYTSADVPVRYPFGHGMSYTKFSYKDLEADSKGVTFTLTNTGTRDGADVAQVYVTCRTGKVYRPRKELKGFQKVFLKAGESRRVHIDLDDKAFRYFNILTGKFEKETANYDVCVCSNVNRVRLSATIRVMGTDAPVPEQDLPNYRTGHIESVTYEEYARLLDRELPQGGPAGLHLNSTVQELAQAKNPLVRAFSKSVRKRVDKKLAAGKTCADELFVLNMPVRNFRQMTGGKITRAMTLDLLYIANGHFFRGMGRFLRDYFRGRKAEKQFRDFVERPMA